MHKNRYKHNQNHKTQKKQHLVYDEWKEETRVPSVLLIAHPIERLRMTVSSKVRKFPRVMVRVREAHKDRFRPF